MSPAGAFYLRIGGAVAVLIAIAAVLYGAYSHGESVADTRWEAKAADQQTLQAKGLAAATTANRNEEQRRQAAVNQVGKDAREQTNSAVADGADADTAGNRVRQQAGTFAAGARCAPVDPGVARRGASATQAAMVLSDLFQRADKRAGELAKAYDAARIAGLACERSYSALRDQAEHSATPQ